MVFSLASIHGTWHELKRKEASDSPSLASSLCSRCPCHWQSRPLRIRSVRLMLIVWRGTEREREIVCVCYFSRNRRYGRRIWIWQEEVWLAQGKRRWRPTLCTSPRCAAPHVSPLSSLFSHLDTYTQPLSMRSFITLDSDISLCSTPTALEEAALQTMVQRGG